MNEKKVLLVEDNIDAVRLVIELLRGFDGFQVTAVSSISLALSELRDTKHELVLLDLNLPDAKEYEAITKIRELNRELPIIVLTASDSAEVAVDVLKLGADDFLVKSRLSAEHLSRSLRYIEEKFRTRAALQRSDEQRSAVVAISQYALKIRELSQLLDYAMTKIQRVLKVGPCRFLRYSRESNTFIVEAASGWRVPIEEQYAFTIEKNTLTGFTLHSGEPVIVDNYAIDQRFIRDPMLSANGVVSGIATVANGVQEPYGILSVHSFEPRKFDRQEAQFLQTIANLVGSAAERIKVERALDFEYNKFRSLFNNAVVGIVISDDDQNNLEANPAACNIFGIDQNEISKRKLSDLLQSSSFLGGDGSWSDFDRSENYEGAVPIIRADGERRLLEFSATPNFSPGLHLSILKDVTERARIAEERDTFFAVSLDIVCIAKPNGYFKRLNPASEKILGYTEEELCARPMTDFIHPGDLDATIGELKHLSEGIDVEAFENRYRCKDGTYKTLSWKSTQVGDNIFATARDMTERNQMLERLSQADRMVTIGTLAAGVAHEINNPLAFVLTNLSLAEDEIGSLLSDRREPKLEPIKKLIVDAGVGGNQLREIVRGLKIFSRAESEKNVPVAPQMPLATAIKMAMHEIEPRAKLVKNFHPMPIVSANEGRLSQVFLNILVNAAHAIPEDQPTQHQITITTRTDSSGNALIEISDSGSGIPPAVLNRIFEPFFTTKAVGAGTGLGLSICHGIVTALGGKIEVDTTLGKGSTFRIVLPPATSTTVEVSDVAPAKKERTQKLKILIIDDQEPLAVVIGQLLGRDFETAVCTDGQKALDLILERRDYDFILCDMMMPGLTGMDIFDHLANDGRGFERRMVFMTGGAFTPRTIEFLQKVDNPRLEKPFGKRAIIDLLDELGRRDGRAS